MRIGEKNKRITIQKNQPVRNSVGEEEEKWIDVIKVWASIEPLSGKELFQAQQVYAEVSTRIKIWYQPSITPDMRILWGTRVFEVLSAINFKEQNKELHFTCKELVR